MNLLALDIGNSSIKVGIFHGEKLIASKSCPTQSSARIPQHWLQTFLKDAGAYQKMITGVAIAGVVPQSVKSWKAACREIFDMVPLVISGKTETPLQNLYRPPAKLGADRLVCAVAASGLYDVPAICVLLGTATVVDAVSAKREFLGGAILPGVGLLADSLNEKTALLPRVKPSPPPFALANETKKAIQSGLIWGSAGAVNELVNQFRKKIGKNARLVVTGGYAPLLLSCLRGRYHYMPHLSLEGIRLVWEHNRSTGG